MRLTYLLRNISFLNILLLITIFIMINHIFIPYIYMRINLVLPYNKVIRTVDNEKIIQSKEFPSLVEYNIIPDENLFHPERKIPIVKKVEEPLPKPQLILYGTLITDDTRVAYVEDIKAPVTTKGRGKRQIPLKTGDVVSGFVVKDIEPDRIIMYRGEEKLVVTIYDSKGHKHKEPLEQQQTKQPQQPSKPDK